MKPWKSEQSRGQWVLSTPDTLLEIFRMSSIFLLYCEPLCTVYFHRGHGALKGEVKIQFNNDGQLVLKGGQLNFGNFSRYVQWAVPELKVSGFRMSSTARSWWIWLHWCFSTSSNSAPANLLCISRRVCQGQISWKSKLESWRADYGTQSCQQPCPAFDLYPTYLWRGVLARSHHLIKLYFLSSSLFLCFPLCIINLAKGNI